MNLSLLQNEDLNYFKTKTNTAPSIFQSQLFIEVKPNLPKLELSIFSHLIPTLQLKFILSLQQQPFVWRVESLNFMDDTNKLWYNGSKIGNSMLLSLFVLMLKWYETI